MTSRNRNPLTEGDFRGFVGLTPCAPMEPTPRCAQCARHRPSLRTLEGRAGVAIDATTVTKPGACCPLFA